MKELLIGAAGTAQEIVDEHQTAAAAGSGDLPVFATPALVALMEQAACAALAPYLTEEETSVGCRISVSHTAATPVGMQVRAEAQVTALSGRMVEFSVLAWDASGPIGEGTHTRAVVLRDRFLQKTYEKL